MDPTIALAEALSALVDLKTKRDLERPTKDDMEEALELREEAVDHLMNLAGWLKRGGFPPDMEKVIEQFEED